MSDERFDEETAGEPRLGPTPAQVTMMSHNIGAAIERDTRRRRRRVRVAAAGAGAALLIGVAVTAGTLAVSRAPEDSLDDTFDCFVTADPGGDVSRVGFVDEVTDEYGSRADFALELCGLVYQRRGIDLPNPTVCELHSLRLGVFPNVRDEPEEQFCTGLGLGLAED